MMKTKNCPVRNSTSHALEECKKSKELPALENEKLVEEHKLCLSCLLPGHRLNKRNARNGCQHPANKDNADQCFIRALWVIY